MVVVESGGTKSTWVFSDTEGRQQTVSSVGLHPRELSSEKTALVNSLVSEYKLQNKALYFFGAGCESTEAKAEIKQFLTNLGLKVKQVETDVYAACIAHLGNKKGIVGILGTGAVAAQFDGHKIVQQTSGLGYMLGDEGSGFDIGKRLLQAYFRNELTTEIREEIENYFNHQSILHRIHESDGRMFIAGLTEIVYKFKENKVVSEIIKSAFLDFCTIALLPFGTQQKVHFIGSIAFYFNQELSKALQEAGFRMGRTEKEAIHRLFSFLSDKILS